MLVWEPCRVVPMYAVPERDVLAALVACPTPEPPADLPRVLGPETFAWHLHPGRSYTVGVGEESFEAAAYRPDDPDLGGRVIIEWGPFDWVEEAQPVTGHPHDPFKRIDVLPADRHVVVGLDGVVLADTRRAVALYETGLPVRWYLPDDDVRTELLAPSPTTSVCAYKGRASYFSLASGEPHGTDLAWSYPSPLPEVAAVAGLVCFFAERTDLRLDGVDVARPHTLWSRGS
jgi:uncharacterized protein (DUF427 family)